MRTAFALLTILVATSLVSSQVRVPIVSEQLNATDGRFSEELWQQSKVLEVESIEIYLVQSADTLYVGIKRDPDVARYVDLFIFPGEEEVINLHASMALGERRIVGAWTDEDPPWQWGNNVDWTANWVETAVDDENLPFLQTVKAYEGYEICIAKDRLPDRFRLYIEIKDFVGVAAAVTIPPEARPGDRSTWLLLTLL